MPPMREVLAGLAFLAAILCAMCAMIYCGIWAAVKLERAALKRDAEEAEEFEREWWEARHAELSNTERSEAKR